MAKVVVTEHLTLDGVMQSPARPDEDTRGGFDKGGWAIPGNDEVMFRVMGEGMSAAGSLLLGRRTYDDFYAYWPNRADNPFTDVLNKTTKYVASRILSEPLPWQNSILLRGDAERAVAELKQSQDGTLGVIGSGKLAVSLGRAGLVDEYVLMIHPLVLGNGQRLFEEGLPGRLRLVESIPTTTGVIIARYQP